MHVEQQPDTLKVLKPWRDAGQPLGNHGWSHLNINDHTAAQFEADIARNEPLLASLMPDTAAWHWFRFPFLNEGDTVEKRREVRSWLSSHGYKTAQVTMSFGDYLWNEPYARCAARHDDASIAQLERSYLSAADQAIASDRSLSRTLFHRDIPYILLMHIGAFDAHMLPRLIDLYRSRGFTFVSLPQAASDPAYAEDPDIGLRSGGTLTQQLMAQRHLALPHSAQPPAQLSSICR